VVQEFPAKSCWEGICIPFNRANKCEIYIGKKRRSPNQASNGVSFRVFCLRGGIIDYIIIYDHIITHYWQDIYIYIRISTMFKQNLYIPTRYSCVLALRVCLKKELHLWTSGIPNFEMKFTRNWGFRLLMRFCSYDFVFKTWANSTKPTSDVARLDCTMFLLN